MKTKNKILAVMEIAIVLCSLFLVATLPAAAITNYESRITNYEKTASEDDYVLGVYGNANEDDTIDMRDLTYVKLIFFGKKPETELADAKYDGKINPLDFIQIKLIIVGKEKELTIVDSVERIVTVKKPVERIAFLNTNTAEILRSLCVEDRVVGVNGPISKKYAELFPVMSKNAANIGGFRSPNYEKIFEVNPQILLNYPEKAPELEKKLEGTGIKVIRLGFTYDRDFDHEITIIGFILGKRDKAAEFLDWKYEYISVIKNRVDKLRDEERVQVFKGGDREETLFSTVTQGAGGMHKVITEAGGKNIAADFSGTHIKVDPEWVLRSNPEAIILMGFSATGYHQKDSTEAKKIREVALNNPILKETDAGKQGRVYVLNYYLTTIRLHIGICYVAKWLYPELFEDIHPEEINREYFERFLRAEYKGSYAYPLPE